MAGGLGQSSLGGLDSGFGEIVKFLTVVQFGKALAGFGSMGVGWLGLGVERLASVCMPSFCFTAMLSQVLNLLVLALQHRFAMEAPAGPDQPFLTIINTAKLEDTISAFMPDDKFILLVAQANSRHSVHARLQERRFLLRLEHGQWVYRDRVRGVRADTTW